MNKTTNNFTPEMFGNRKIALVALTGSHNYNLDGPESDEDYKVFVIPTFEDLYNNTMFSTQIQSGKMDFACHDIRQLGRLIWKSNLNFLEVLMSVQFETDFTFIKTLRSLADEFAKINLRVFGKATYGMHMQKMKTLHKGTEKTQTLVDKFGYDTKDALHSLRCLIVLDRVSRGIALSDAIWFENDSRARNLLLSVKRGEVLESRFHEIIDEWHTLNLTRVNKFFNTQEPNEKLNHDLNVAMKEFVQGQI